MSRKMSQSLLLTALAVGVTVASITSVAAAMHTRRPDTAARATSLSAPVCVRVGGPRQFEPPVWHDAPSLPGAAFAVVWNPDFLVFEILWANTTDRPVHFRFVTDSGRAVAQRPAPRRLGPMEKESLPGATVIPAARTRQVCVRTDDAS